MRIRLYFHFIKKRISIAQLKIFLLGMRKNEFHFGILSINQIFFPESSTKTEANEGNTNRLIYRLIEAEWTSLEKKVHFWPYSLEATIVWISLFRHTLQNVYKVKMLVGRKCGPKGKQMKGRDGTNYTLSTWYNFGYAESPTKIFEWSLWRDNGIAILWWYEITHVLTQANNEAKKLA